MWSHARVYRNICRFLLQILLLILVPLYLKAGSPSIYGYHEGRGRGAVIITWQKNRKHPGIDECSIR